MIKIENLSKTYPLGSVRVSALQPLSLTIEGGEFLAVAGASGSGKSTLLNLIGGVESPTTGTIAIGGVETTGLSSAERADMRARRIGFVFQTFNLLPTLTAFENIEYPLYLKGTSPTERRERVQGLLKEVGLDRFASHNPSQLSGGQRQRVAIARALANTPDVILADEPTANLDQSTGAEIIRLLKELNQKTRVTVLLATHDPAIMSQAHRVLELRDGQILNDRLCS